MSNPTVTVFDTHQELEKLWEVCGGWVTPYTLPDGRIMYSNEEGLLKGLPVNHEASQMAGRLIVGNVAILPRRVL